MEGMVFKNLFTQEEGLETFCLKGRFPRMVEDEMEMLRKDITEETNMTAVYCWICMSFFCSASKTQLFSKQLYADCSENSQEVLPPKFWKGW